MRDRFSFPSLLSQKLARRMEQAVLREAAHPAVAKPGYAFFVSERQALLLLVLVLLCIVTVNTHALEFQTASAPTPFYTTGANIAE